VLSWFFWGGFFFWVFGFVLKLFGCEFHVVDSSFSNQLILVSELNRRYYTGMRILLSEKEESGVLNMFPTLILYPIYAGSSPATRE
jgi:hypothetical protein